MRRLLFYFNLQQVLHSIFIFAYFKVKKLTTCQNVTDQDLQDVADQIISNANSTDANVKPIIVETTRLTGKLTLKSTGSTKSTNEEPSEQLINDLFDKIHVKSHDLDNTELDRLYFVTDEDLESTITELLTLSIEESDIIVCLCYQAIGAAVQRMISRFVIILY